MASMSASGRTAPTQTIPGSTKRACSSEDIGRQRIKLQANVITAAEAAREKGCTDQAIYNALDRGDLNEVRMGGMRLILKDAAYRAYQVKATGGRVHKRYQEKHKGGK